MCKVFRAYRIFKHDAEKLELLFNNPSKAVRLLIAAYVQRNELPTKEQINELVQLRTEVHRIGVNINQIARRKNAGKDRGIEETLEAELADLKIVLCEIRKYLRGSNGS